MSDRPLTHLGDDGLARMVDVGAKPETERVARARARLRMSPQTARAVEAGDGPKGEVLGVARLAGIQAAKRTEELIPLAHPLPLSFADVSATVDAEAGVVDLVAEARTVARTGVEMEAMTACAVAALTRAAPPLTNPSQSRWPSSEYTTRTRSACRPPLRS